MGKLQDKVALITGSDSGIGQATAIEFAREGADVIVHYLSDEEGANFTRKQVEAKGRRAIVVHGDHGDEEQVAAWFAAALQAFGRVDFLMNNASVDASGTYVADLQIADFERTLRSNLIGQVICAKHFINHRKRLGGGGKIINTTSVHEEQPRAGAADYDCSNGAHPFQPEGDRRPRLLGGAGAEHPAQTRRAAAGDRPPGCLPRLQRRRLRHRGHLRHGRRADADVRPGRLTRTPTARPHTTVRRPYDRDRSAHH